MQGSEDVVSSSVQMIDDVVRDLGWWVTKWRDKMSPRRVQNPLVGSALTEGIAGRQQSL